MSGRLRRGRLDAFEDDTRRGQAFLALPQVTLERAARLIASRYGPIPMWITEYNVIGYYGPKQGDSDSDTWIQSTRDTPWNALYQAGFWLTGLARPNALEILNHHSVTNTDLGWGLGEAISEKEANLTITGAAIGIVAGRTFSDRLPLTLTLPRSGAGLGLTVRF